MSGARFPNSGRVQLGRVAFSELSARPKELRRLRARVGVVHQDFALVPNLRVIQNVVSGGLSRRGFWGALRSLTFPGKATSQEVHGLLQRLGIAEKLYQRTDTLSGGQQQRVALARALYQDPCVLLADEPVASVDPARARAVLELILQVAEERGLSIVVSLHDAELARALFPRVVGMREGRIYFDRATSELDAADFQQLYSLDSQ